MSLLSVGFHFQREVDGWVDAVKRLPSGTPIKAIDQVQMLGVAKSANPGVVTILRHWYDFGQQFDGGRDGNIKRARDFFGTFVDGTFDTLAHSVDFIEGFNEYYGNSQSPHEKEEILNWVWAANEVWSNEYRNKDKYRHIRLITGNTAIGNDIPIEAAQIVYQHGGVLGYHPYITIDSLNSQGVPEEESNNFNPGGIHPGDWRWYSGRWEFMDEMYRNEGVFVDWMFTEFGPIERRADGGLDPQNGWRHQNVFNGNVQKYIDSLQYWLTNARDFNAAHGNRALGAVLFNSGGDGKIWKYFETKQPELSAIANWVFGFNYNPSTTEEPEPPVIVDVEEPPPPLPVGGSVLITREKDSFDWVHLPIKQNATVMQMRFNKDGGSLIERRYVKIPEGTRSFTIAPLKDVVQYTGNSLGCDISRHQGAVDFFKMRSKVEYVFMKAAQGDWWTDPNFLGNLASAIGAGFSTIGVYHYYENGNKGPLQARYFVSSVPSTFDGVWICDIEHTIGETDPDDVANYLEEVEQLTGKKPMIYTGGWWWNPRMGIQGWEKDYRLWVARYGPLSINFPKAWISGNELNWNVWQYTNKGNGVDYGVSSQYIDLNISNGHILEHV